MPNYKVKITIQNVNTAHEVTLTADTEIINKKFSLFKKNLLDVALKQVAGGLDDDQDLRNKNADFLKQHGLTQ